MDTRAALKQELQQKTKQIFKHNRIEKYSSWKQTKVRFIAPATKEYTFQFLWDTAFHSIVLSHFDTNWAKSEIKNFLLAQYPSGFLPHIIFWGEWDILPHWAYIESALSVRPRTTALTQPPMLAIAVETIYKKDKDKKFLQEVLPKLAAYHRWVIEHRDPDGDGLVSIISANESGLDELPVFQYVLGYYGNDPAVLHYVYRKPDLLNQLYRFKNERIFAKDYFNCEDLVFNTVSIEARRSLARLFMEIGKPEEAEFFRTGADTSERRLLEKCWNEKDRIFYSLFSKKEKQAKVKTIASLIPLFLDGLKGEKLEAIVSHLINPKEFWTEYPVPSVAKSEHYYNPNDIPPHHLKLIWRGPTWVNTNWFIVKGLRKHGYDKIADQIVERTLEMINNHGFREYYNPETGAGYRRHNFGWSTLILDLI